jgi:putative cell wall-binding protein
VICDYKKGYYDLDGTKLFGPTDIYKVELGENGYISSMRAMPFHDGKAIVQISYEQPVSCEGAGGFDYKESPFLVIDKTGKILKEMETYPGLYYGGEGLTVDFNGWCYYDYDGNNVIDLTDRGYARYTGSFFGGHCWVRDEETLLYGFIDKTGTEVIPCQYENVAGFYDGFTCVRKEGKEGLINDKNELVIPIEYDDVFYFGEGLVAVQKDGKYGLIDLEQNVVVPFEWDDMSSFNGGAGYAIKDGILYTINKAGEEPVEPTAADVTRIFGASRYDTSIKSADALKEQLGLDKFDSVIVACVTNYADALAGSYLSCVKKAPILLVRNRDAEIKLVQDYIKANLNEGGTIYLLGGSAVVPDSAVAGLTGFKTNRLWGKDRYETNVKILEEAGVSGDEILVASGTGFADSLSASASGKPILLVKNAIQPSQQAFVNKLNGKRFYLIGGTGAVNADLENYFKTLGLTTRLGGATRFDTSVKVAETFFKNPEGAVLAYGQDFPDGLCGGSVANAMGGPLLLATSGKADQAAAYAKANGIKTGAVLGGPTLISDAAVKTIFQMGANDKIVVK